MVDLVLRPSSLDPDRPFALQLRWHESLGETEYVTIARVEHAVAEEIIRAGTAYYLFGEKEGDGADLKAEIVSLRKQLAEIQQARPGVNGAAEQGILDAIRSAYDQGYNDARNAKSVPGDSAAGYRGRLKAAEISHDAVAALSRNIVAVYEGPVSGKRHRSPPVPTEYWTAEENNNFDPPFALRYDPTPGGRRNSDGTTTFKCTAPMLRATGWLGEPMQALEKIAAALNDYADLFTLRRERDWHEDYGNALWWTNPVAEPPYVGSPLDCNWPGYHKWWTPLPSGNFIQGWFDARRAAAKRELP